MLRRSSIAALLLSGWTLGCSSSTGVEEARPVATPSLTVSPSTVASGSPIEIAVRFDVAADAPPFEQDYTVFVHVLTDDGRMIGALDHTPPTPTSAWKPGATVAYTQSGFAPTSTYVGLATVVVGLYAPATGVRLPLAGEAAEPRAIKVASFEMRERTDPYAVVFREGWHAAEVPRGAGIQWRWSTKTGALSFANPRRAVDLVLEFDQPNAIFDVAQHVEIRVGETVADAFDLEPGPPRLRRIALGMAELGEQDEVRLTVVSDKTFIPAKVASLQSSDTRQLGIRVFRAYVEPKQ